MSPAPRSLVVACVLMGGVGAGVPAAHGAYAPRVELTVPADGGPSSPAAVSSLITQEDGEDATRTIEARLPGTFGFNAAFALVGCTAQEERAAACPESSRIGVLEADSPFGPASGTMHLTEDFRLFGKIEAYGGLVRLTVNGVMEVLPGQEVVVRFDDLPEVPSRRMRLALEGGTRTPLALPRDCGTHVIKVRLVSHAGDVRDSEHPVLVAGCPRVPEILSARVDRARVAPRSGALLRWRLRGDAVRTEVTLRELVRGRWHERGTVPVATTAGVQTLRVGPRWRGSRLRAGRYRAVLVVVAADGTRSLQETVDLRLGGSRR